jgi:predicted metalloprotease with PDZ domain
MGLASYKYTVRFSAPITHYAEVEALFPTDGAEELVLFLAVWTPGSYLVREYARNLEDFEAFDEAGVPLRAGKTRKNRWSVETKGAGVVRVTYRLYCHEMSVRTNWVDEDFALLHGAATFLSVVGELDRTHEVTVVAPEGWLGTAGGVASGTYDELVDAPILVGNPDVREFEVDGKKHLLATQGDGVYWDAAQAVGDVEKIVRQQMKMWGSLPYEQYTFLNVLLDGKAGGGLEHKNSFCILTSRYAMRTRESYLKWLDLVSHEFFHVWNVKRLRPVELGPFDYENENYTRGLWVSEGFTEYYGGLMVYRAGLMTREEYLNDLSGMIETLQTTPGRLAQPVGMSSYDAWIKLYRPDENSCNTAISYYTKGALIAWILDAKIRAATHGAKSLDDAMRLLYERFSGERGFEDRDIRKAAEEVAGIELDDWFHDAVETTKELDYTEALAHFELRFQKASAEKKAWLGFTTKTDGGRLTIATVPRLTPAFDAGFSPDDEILALGDYRVLPDQWTKRMEQLRPGEQISVLVSRRGKLTTVAATLAQDPGKQWQLEPVSASPRQLQQL